jgi:TldD protein
MEDHLEFILNLATKLGCTYAEARFQNDYNETNLLKNGIPEASSFSTKKGIGIRVLIDGALAFGATNQLSKRELRGLVQKLVSIAKASRRLRDFPIRFSSDDMAQGRVEEKPRIRFEDVGLESRMELLREADEAALTSAKEKGIKLPGRFFSLDTLITEKMIMNTDGAMIYSWVPRAELDMLLTAFSPEKGSVQRMHQKGETSGWESVERWDIPDSTFAEVETLGSILNEAKEMKSERCDVILGQEVVGIVSHESSGHPGEADRILGREAAQAGETYLDRDSLGRKVGSEVVNVVEDPTLPRSFGFYLYDEEGVKARRRHLIKEGRINEFLHNRETAMEMGVISNASSRSVAFDREPIVRMANTYVEKGDHSLEELLEGVNEGVYLKNFMEWNIDDRRFNQRYVGLEAYRIVKGELGERLRNPVLEITTTGLWSAVDAVGNKVNFFSGYCGKGDPMQGIPVWMGGPEVRLRNIKMGGTA